MLIALVAIVVVNIILLIILAYQIRRLNRILKRIDITIVEAVMEHEPNQFNEAFNLQKRLQAQCGMTPGSAWSEAKTLLGIKRGVKY